MRAAGTSGELTAGGRWVATLGMWSARLGDEGGTIKAALTEGNEFWLTSLTRADVSLDVGKRRWLWPRLIWTTRASTKQPVLRWQAIRWT